MLRFLAMPFRASRFIILPLVGAALGLGWNALSGRGFALDRNVLVKAGDEVIPVEEAKKRFDQGALFVDARPADVFAVSHIPRALSLPEDTFAAAFQANEARLRSSLDVVVYCSGFGCEASHNVARKLKEAGIPAVVLHDGWPAWTGAGYAATQGTTP